MPSYMMPTPSLNPQLNIPDDKKSGSTSAQSPAVGQPYFGFSQQPPMGGGFPQYPQYMPQPFIPYPYGVPTEPMSNQFNSLPGSEHSSQRPARKNSDEFSSRVSPVVHHQSAKNLNAAALHGLDKPAESLSKKQDNFINQNDNQNSHRENWNRHKIAPELKQGIKPANLKDNKQSHAIKNDQNDISPKVEVPKQQEKPIDKPEKVKLDDVITPQELEKKTQVTDSSKILRLLKEVKTQEEDNHIHKNELEKNNQAKIPTKTKKQDKKQRKLSRSRSKSKPRASEDEKISNSSRKRIEMLNKRFDMFFQKKKEEPEDEEPDYTNQDLSPRTPEDQDEDI